MAGPYRQERAGVGAARQASRFQPQSSDLSSSSVFIFASGGSGVGASFKRNGLDQLGLPNGGLGRASDRPCLDDHHEKAQGKEPAWLFAGSCQRGAKNPRAEQNGEPGGSNPCGLKPQRPNVLPNRPHPLPRQKTQ